MTENVKVTEKGNDGAIFLFHQGTNFRAYEYMGCHPLGKDRTVFRTWAPKADSIELVSDFTGWDEGIPFEKVSENGIWHAIVDIPYSELVGKFYKFRVTGGGVTRYKSDPYAFESQTLEKTASIVAKPSDFAWNDSNWLKHRKSIFAGGRHFYSAPMNIYEMHLGSWRTRDGADNSDGKHYLNYREIADLLVPYVKHLGYTHIELMPIAEYPFDGSWGYQVTGYYAPTSRYGTPQDFKYMVDYLHRQKIGIILDWVPAHFPKDAHGLANFDGTAVYEHADPRQGEHPDWGTKIYNYGRPEVKNFLIANALYWVEECHVDGLRVDAVASMLYLDYGKKDGEWVANKYGGNKNLEAIEFFKHLNTVVLGRNHGTVMIAEESTAWPMVTGKAEDDGLGFSLKWNMGWMNDFLEYMKLDPYFRKFNHNKMTFSMTYAYSEKYVLVLSHDEVVHLKCSMLEKMPGELDDKFKNLKAGYTFMFGHPGKKLLFMGQDFGQLREWSEARELDWYLLGEENHQKLQQYVSDLLHIYRKYPALYGADNDPSAFEWINANDGDRSIFSFVRKSPTRRNNILIVCNFTPVARPDYRVGVPKKKQYKLIMNEQGLLPKGKAFKAEKKNCDNREFSFAYPLEAYGVGVFTY